VDLNHTAQVDGNDSTIISGAAKLVIPVDASTPIEVKVERDYPVRFVSIGTREKQEGVKLAANCEIHT